MGRICPILNHPLNDGVLIKDDALVSFIQKRNVDFLAHEYVCRSCKREIEKLYQKKLKKATKLQRSRYHDGSISTLKTSRETSSSGASTTSERSVVLSRSQSRDSNISEIGYQNINGSSTNMEKDTNGVTSANIVAVSATSVQILASYNNESFALQENQLNLPNIPKNTLDNLGVKSADNVHNNVTIRKKTIKDFYAPKPQNLQENNDADDNVIRRLSQEPTTSRAAMAGANSNKRPVSLVDEEDDVALSLNAYNGTILPNIQPVISKRRSLPNTINTIGRDIMDNYIKDITGG